jgi:hypothetical protein
MQNPEPSLTSLKNRTLEEEIKAWDNDGTLQSLHEAIIEIKRREKIEEWRLKTGRKE